MKTRSIRYGAARSIEFIEYDVPDPEPGQVQIEVGACGICASDLYTYRHGTTTFFGAGHEGVGRVARLGAGVTHLRVGDRVTGHGLGFARLANIPAAWAYPLPDSPLADEHWIVEPAACAVTGLDHCQLRPGDRVALVGCGFMGLMLIQGLGHSWAEQVIAIDIDEHRLQLAQRFGATRTLNSSAPSFSIEELRGLGIDCVIDASGAQQGLNLSTEIVRRGGRINLFGWNHGTPTFPGDRWHIEGLTVVNSAPNSAVRDPWPAAIRLLHRGILDLRPLVTHTVPLEGYPALLEEVSARRNGYIKGVVKLG